MGHEKEIEKYLADQAKKFQEYLKKNPLKKAKKRVKQRSKRGPITVEGPISPSVPLKRGVIQFTPELEGVDLKVTATPAAWKKIAKYCLEHPDRFGLDFFSFFANPAILWLFR